MAVTPIVTPISSRISVGNSAPTVAATQDYHVYPLLLGGSVFQAGVITVPATIADGATFTSSVLSTYGMSHFAVSAQTDHAATLSIQLYLDAAGTIPNGAAITKAMTANTLALQDTSGTVIAQSMTISIINSAGAIANVAQAKFCAVVHSK